MPRTLDLKGNKFQTPRSFEKFAAADSKIFFLKWKEFDHQKHLKKKERKIIELSYPSIRFNGCKGFLNMEYCFPIMLSVKVLYPFTLQFMVSDILTNYCSICNKLPMVVIVHGGKENFQY